jgi:hypothetical protein
MRIIHPPQGDSEPYNRKDLENSARAIVSFDILLKIQELAFLA